MSGQSPVHLYHYCRININVSNHTVVVETDKHKWAKNWMQINMFLLSETNPFIINYVSSP